MMKCFLCILSGISLLGMANPVMNTGNENAIQQYIARHNINHAYMLKKQKIVLAKIASLAQMPSEKIKQALTDINQQHKPLDYYPVVSKSLSVGKVKVRKVNYVLPAPIFLIGDDKVSLAWLKAHRKALLESEAIGFVVNIDSAKKYKQLIKTYPTLRLMPMQADMVSGWLSVKYYPVIISDHKIYQ